MTEPLVTHLVRVRQGRVVVQFELSDKGLTIEVYSSKRSLTQEPHRVTIKGEAVMALRDLLVPGIPVLPDAPAERPTGSIPKEGLQGERTPEGLLKTEDGVESGMD